MGLINQAIEAKSDQWNASDFLGSPRTFTIERVNVKPGQEQPVSIKLEGETKVWRPSKGMSRAMVAAWGDEEGTWAGKSVTLFHDPTAMYSGAEVGGIRISAMSHIDRPLKVAIRTSRTKTVVMTFQPIKTRPAAETRPPEPETPAAMPEADAIALINATETLADLQTVFTKLNREHRATAGLAAVIKAKDDRKAALTPAPDAPADDDEIPL